MVENRVVHPFSYPYPIPDDLVDGYGYLPEIDTR